MADSGQSDGWELVTGQKQRKVITPLKKKIPENAKTEPRKEEFWYHTAAKIAS